MLTPNTDIYLLKCDLSLSNKHQITFTDADAQHNYFDSLDKLLMDDNSYQRKDNSIRYNGHIDDIQEYNYCMYRNNNYTNKWFYAFITDMKYVNDGMTLVEIKTDVFQTWQFDLIWKQSFIDREMLSVADDIAGANLLPEGLETGEYKVVGTADFDELEHIYCVAYTGDTIDQTSIGQDGYDYNGISSSVTFIFCNNEAGFHVLIGVLQQTGNSDKILTAFTIPKLAVLDKIHEIETDPTVDYYYFEPMDYNYSQSEITKTLSSTPSTLDGYTPRNQKLKTFPFTYLGFNPTNGTSKIYRYEDFLNGTPSFKLISELNQNPTVAFVPQNYRGATGDSMSDISYLNGYPTISYKNDVFNTWLAQNGEIISLQTQHEQNVYGIDVGSNIANSTIGFVGSLFSLNVGGMASSISSGITNGMRIEENHDYFIKNQMAQIERQKLLPDNATLSSTNATLLGYNKMKKNIFSRYSIKYQFAERIDKYFDMYGYATNTLKLPNLNNRPNWNYVKTVGANIEGHIPQLDLEEIKQLFNSGITLWHNTSTFLDYSQDNRTQPSA